MEKSDAVISTAAAWRTVALLWPVALLNYLDRQMLATMGLSIKADIVELRSAEMFGQLMAVFMWVYALSSPFSGAIADRVNRKWLIVASLGIWSGVTLLMGSARGYHELYWLRAIMGLSEAFYIPAGLSLIADYHRGSTRSLAMGVHMSGIYMGQALGGVGGWVAQDISWRAAFVGCGFIGVAYALVLMVFLRERPKEMRDSQVHVEAARPSAFIHWRGFAILMLVFSLPSIPGWAVKNWLPTMLQDRFMLEQSSAGLWATMTNAGAAFFGVIVGGHLSDSWTRSNVRGRTWATGAGLFLMAPVLVGMGLAPNLSLTILCTLLFGFGFGMFDANNMPILCQIAPPHMRATGYGLLNFIGISAGAFITPLLGKMKDNGVSLAACFSLCAIPALLAAVLVLLIQPEERDCGAIVNVEKSVEMPPPNGVDVL